MQEFPRSAFAVELAIDDPQTWTNQVFLQAVEYAYELLPSDFILTTTYQQTTYEVCRRNIALAGYRLSDKIVEALGNQTVSAGEAEIAEGFASSGDSELFLAITA